MEKHKTYSSKQRMLFYSRGNKLANLALRQNSDENYVNTTIESTSTMNEIGLDDISFDTNKDESLLNLSLADISIGQFTDLDNSDFVVIPLHEALEASRTQSNGHNSELRNDNQLCDIISEGNTHFQPNNEVSCINGLNRSSNSNDFYDVNTSNPVTENSVQYTKAGTIRKRKKYNTSVEERKKIKQDSVILKHSLKPPCSLDECKKKCLAKISEERRIVLNTAYWSMKSENERKSFILNNVTCVDVKQRKVIAENNNFQRKKNHEYTLKDDKGISQIVCKTFFMSTLGYFTNSDKFMRNVTQKTECIVPPVDKRRVRVPRNKIDGELIRKHILEFQPCTSHYRREHAPNRLYLPSDLTFASMHKDFITKHPEIKCSYEKYRVYAREEMNISIVTLGHEECEKCEEFRLHDKTHTACNLEKNCECCVKWQKHNEKVKLSRSAYQIDAETQWENNVAVYSVDLQKVIMLPRLDMFKSAIFVQRLTTYNESFVPVGKNKVTSRNQIMAALWHEAISGRNKEDLVSTFYKFVTSHREDKKIILWLDNCTSQNKNWTLFSFFIYIMNSNEIDAEEIVLKYFEPGHSFMSADSFHHRVEMSMKKAGGKIYDFEDFCRAVSQSSKHVDVKRFSHEDFYVWEDYSSQPKLKKINPRPYLNEMVEVTFRKGSYDLFYRKSYDGEVLSVNFLLTKFMKMTKLPGPKKNNKAKGLSKEKKNNLIKTLEPIILPNRLKFWLDLPESN